MTIIYLCVQWFASPGVECHHGAHRERKDIVSLCINPTIHDLQILVHSVYFYSLLDILAGRKDRSGLVGQVMVNGEHQPSNFKCISGYVVQVSDIKGP